MSRARALVLSGRLPWPLDDGGHIAVWQTLWAAARDRDTTLISMVPPERRDDPLPEAFAALGVEVVRVAHRPPPMPLALLRGALGRWPYMLARYRDAGFDAAVRRQVAERRPEVAFLNNLHLATYLDALAGVPAVLRTQNLEHLWLARFAERQANPAARLYVRHQVHRMRQAERELVARCDLVLSINPDETEALRALAPSARVETVPLGIDLDRFRPRAPASPPIVALIGSWEWPPNVDGGRAFIERGWPVVRDRVPQARLRVVGKGLPAELAELARRAGADVAGYVDDMTVEFAQAAVMVVPLWMGTGIRVKIVEGLAARVPVVTTTIGAEGLSLEPGVHAAFADEPEDLGRAVVDLLRDPHRAQAMADAGCALVRAHHSLPAVATRMREHCEAMLAERARRGRR